MKRKRKSVLLLALIFFVTAGAAFYFLQVDSLWARIKKGLDIQGGIHVVFEGADVPGMPATSEAMDQAKNIIEERVNRLGVTEPIIQRQGEKRIVVELPGIRDPEKALEAIGRTAILEFKDSEGKVIVTGKDLDPRGVNFNLNTGGNEWVVSLRFKGEGVRRFAEATREAVKFPKEDPRRRIGIFLDGEEIQNPSVNDAIETGDAIITGYATVDEAKSIAVSLQSGALPVKLNVIENRTISPTLGQDSLRRSESAALIGIIAVLAFVFLFYRIPGFWADFALLVYFLLFLGILVAIDATLTLPGIAGFILSVGMAVDANIVIFERIKDELRLGKTIRTALDAGFANALRAVIDSNATTVIGAGVLFYFGTGPVRGFALTLILGVLISLFTAVVVTRYVLRLLVASGLKAGPLFFAPVSAGAGTPPERGGALAGNRGK